MSIIAENFLFYLRRCVFVCVCVFVREREREKGGGGVKISSKGVE